MRNALLNLVRPFLSRLTGAQFPVGFWTQAAPAASGPDILWWKCNESSGATIAAAVGPGSTNSTFTRSGSAGQYALASDGTKTASSSSAVTFGTNKITVEFRWNQTSSFPDGFIIGTGDGSGTADCWCIKNYYGLSVYMYDADGYHLLNKCCTEPSAGSVHHIAVVLDKTANAGAGEIKIYIDGEPVATTLITNTHSSTNNFAALSLSLPASGAIVGTIDGIRIYSGERTSTQIAADAAEVD